MKAPAAIRPARTLLAEVDTPAVIVDADRLNDNLERMADAAHRAGLDLRPHAKTHKSIEIARRQLARGGVGITVAKPQEALVFWRAGIKSIFLAYPPVGDLKLAAIRPMVADGVLTVGLDSLDTGRPLAELATTLRVRVGVLVEVDVGMHRAGVAWGKPAADLAIEIAHIPGLKLLGLFCHEGHAHQLAQTGDLAGFASLIADRMRQTAEMTRSQGVPCAVVSAGTSLTAWHLNREQGLTEMRPGTYVFNDVRTVMDGGASWDECAVSVLATVVSRSEPARAVIDAGSKIFTPTVDERYGFGAVQGVPGARLVQLSEEHGVMALDDPAVDLKIGDRVRVIPIHVCVVVNMQRELIEVRHDEAVGRIAVDASLCSR